MQRRVADALFVAPNHLRNSGIDEGRTTRPLLPCSTTFVTDGDRHLITAAAIIGGSAKNVTCHEKQPLVVIERSAGVSAKLGHRLAECRERFGRHFDRSTCRDGDGFVGSPGASPS
jgi:hypothetical protein